LNFIICTGRWRGWENHCQRKSRRDALLFAPRCVKDLIEEKIYERRRDLFGDLSLVFFDTTSIYFEVTGGRTLEHTGTQRTIVLTLSRLVVGIINRRTGPSRLQ